MRAGQLKTALERFIRDVWDLGDAEAAGSLLADAYAIHHDPGDPWEGRTLDLEGYKDRVRLSRAPFPDQTFDIPGFPATGRTVHVGSDDLPFHRGGQAFGALADHRSPLATAQREHGVIARLRRVTHLGTSAFESYARGW